MLQFEHYIEDAKKQRDLLDFKNEIGMRREDSDMKRNLGVDVERRDLLFRQRVQWDKDKILYLFKKQDNKKVDDLRGKASGLDDEVFQVRKKRLNYLTKGQRLREIDQMRDKIGSHLLELDETRADFVTDLIHHCSKLMTQDLKFKLADPNQRQLLLEKEERNLKRRHEQAQKDSDTSEHNFNFWQDLYKKEDTYNRVKDQYGIEEVDDDDQES